MEISARDVRSGSKEVEEQMSAGVRAVLSKVNFVRDMGKFLAKPAVSDGAIEAVESKKDHL
jgi:hypothetical protein